MAHSIGRGLFRSARASRKVAAVTTSTLLVFGAANAQETAAGEGGESMQLQEIVVTGSRIRRSDTATAAPITVVDQQALADRGFTQVGQALNETTANVPSRPLSPLNGDSSGGGEQYPALFGLGAGRTLTLVNGRRYVTSAGSFSSGFGSSTNDSVVDTNMIPIGLLKSVEIVQGGGAAVYGSDAMGGVVNYIFRDDFEGLEFDAQYGQSTRGDYETPSARVTWGTNFADRGNVAVNVEWSRTDPLLPTDRQKGTRILVSSSNPANTGPNDGRPSVLPVSDAHFWEFNEAGVLFAPPNPTCFPNRCFITTDGRSYASGGIPAQFNADGTALVGYNPGSFPSAGPSIPFSSGGDGFEYKDLTALYSGVERTAANIIGHYDLTDTVKLSTELMYATVEGEDPRAEIPSNTILNSADTGSGAIPIRASNAFLTPEARASIVNYLNSNPALFGPNSGFAWAAGAPIPVTLSKSWADLTPSPVGEREVDTVRALVALQGDFTFADREMYWEVSASHAEVDGSIRTWGVWQARYNNAINSVLDAGGAPACAINVDADPNNNDASCSPINPFGVGTVSDAARNYVSTRFGQDYQNTQRDYLATLGGDAFTIPGGVVRFSVGFEHREEEAEFDPLPAEQAGLGRLGVPTPAQRGEYDTNEFSAELLIPIVGADFTFPGAEAVELTGAFRTVDHSLAGSENVWSTGLRWTIVPDITLRGSRSRNFRAPNLTQLFAPAQVQLGAISRDPCDADRINDGTNPAVRLANCQALFAANPGYGSLATFQDPNENFAGALITSGGNPDLENEISDTWSYGFIFQPRFVEGLTLIVDRVEIELENGLSFFQPLDFLATCFDSSPQPADICAISTRNEQGHVIASSAITFNAGSIRFRGETYNLSYVLPVGPGDLSLAIEATHVSLLETSVTGVDLTRTDGTAAQPDWRSRFDVRYTVGPVRLAYSLNYLPSVRSTNTSTVETTLYPVLDDNYRHNVSAQYDLTEALTLRAGVENLTDEMPSFPSTQYGDILGRQYYMGINAKF
ncbi:MAG TPA: TonB-dependent receptor [Steroidobacter sp.]|uniref:TonB-dependent receptor domain-containing protein n=1 Tax=Steroidobacter sp. TaxID=1978227 RepID=UPI002ED9FCD1